MQYWRCESEDGGTDTDTGDDSASDETADGDDVSGDDGDGSDDDDGSDDTGDADPEPNYRSFLGLDGNRSGNPYGISLGADEYIDKLDRMQQDVDRYSPRDYADGRGDAPRVPEQRPMDVPYTGAPDLPLIKIDVIPDRFQKLDIPLGDGWTLKLRFTEHDYGVGLEGEQKIPLVVEGVPLPLGFREHGGFYANFENPEKSDMHGGYGVFTPFGNYDFVHGEYTVEQFLNDAKTMYDGALREIGYPPTVPNGNPW